MKLYFKQFKTGRRTSTMTLDHDNSLVHKRPFELLKALAILMGGYNVYGRHIPLEEYQDLKKEFENLLEKVADL